MSVTIPTKYKRIFKDVVTVYDKDLGDVKDVYIGDVNCGLEKRCSIRFMEDLKI